MKEILVKPLPSDIKTVYLDEGESIILGWHEYVNRNGKLKAIGENINGVLVEINAFTKKDPEGNSYSWDVDSTGIIHHIYLK